MRLPKNVIHGNNGIVAVLRACGIHFLKFTWHYVVVRILHQTAGSIVVLVPRDLYDPFGV